MTELKELMLMFDKTVIGVVSVGLLWIVKIIIMEKIDKKLMKGINDAVQERINQIEAEKEEVFRLNWEDFSMKRIGDIEFDSKKWRGGC